MYKQKRIVRPVSRRHAFTLVELLVVIGIIALLISILLPALGRAREAANSVKCLANLRSFGQAMQNYVAENKGWLAGPNTSGRRASVDTGALAWSDQTDPSEATQNMDWISPTLGRELNLPTNRGERLLAILNQKVVCPSNDLYYANEYSGAGSSGSELSVDATEVRYSSYSAALAFHLVTRPPGITSTKSSIIALPDGYAPRLTKVGSGGAKIFAFDGARYANGSSVSFNAFIKQIRGGNFMDYGVATPEADLFRLSNDLKLTQTQKNLAFRHRGKINVVFFDGHAASLDVEESLATSLWWPKGSRVVSGYPVGFQDKQAVAGQVID